MKKIRYPTIDEVEWFHDRILQLTGGERGDLARANLEFALERVRDVGEGLDHEKAIAKKAAFLLTSFVAHHPFINGSKRTAFEVVVAFLEMNGYNLQARNEDSYGLLADAGDGKITESGAEHWITMNLAKRTMKKGGTQ